MGLLCLTLLASCRDTPQSRPKPGATSGGVESVSLNITVSDGRGSTHSARLSCTEDGAAVSGFLTADATELCRRARSLASFLETAPDPNRICAQIYGGPETAHIEGAVGGRRIDRRFARTDACETADWDRVAGLLGAAPR